MTQSRGLKDVNEVSGVVVDAAMKVHTALGPGLLESAYEACLLQELGKRRLKVIGKRACPLFTTASR